MTDREKGFYHIRWNEYDTPDIAEYDGGLWRILGRVATENDAEMEVRADIGPKIEVPPVEENKALIERIKGLEKENACLLAKISRWSEEMNQYWQEVSNKPKGGK